MVLRPYSGHLRYPCSAPARQPTPWRMAELEELMHAAENRQRERDMVQAAAEHVAEAQAQVEG